MHAGMYECVENCERYRSIVWHEKFYLGRSEFVGRGGRRGLKEESMHKKEQ